MVLSCILQYCIGIVNYFSHLLRSSLFICSPFLFFNPPQQKLHTEAAPLPNGTFCGAFERDGCHQFPRLTFLLRVYTGIVTRSITERTIPIQLSTNIPIRGHWIGNSGRDGRITMTL